jgi:hypothetical protein
MPKASNDGTSVSPVSWGTPRLVGYSTVWRTRSGAAGPNKLQFGSVLQMNFPVRTLWDSGTFRIDLTGESSIWVFIVLLPIFFHCGGELFLANQRYSAVFVAAGGHS